MLEIFECPVSYDVMPSEVKTHVDEINRMGIDIIDIEHLSKGVCDGSETVDEWTVTSYNYLSGQIHAKSFSIFDECAERNVKTSVITLPAAWATKWARGIKSVNKRGGYR